MQTTMRDYFAAHAPAVIPDWFQIDDLRPAPVLPSSKELTEGQRFEVGELCGGAKIESEVSLEAVAFNRRYLAAKADLHAWAVEHESARYFAWRWHYADKMLKGRA